MTSTNNQKMIDTLISAFSNLKDSDTDASVLIVLRLHFGKLQVLLTQRSEKMRSHAGEWSLPGGKTELGESNWQTAIREANEEVGLCKQDIVKIGQLQNFKSKENLSVGVCVCVLNNEDIEFVLNKSEVQKIHWMNLTRFFEKPDREELFERNGYKVLIPFYDHLKPSLWGLTAIILQTLFKRLTIDLKENPQMQILLSNK